MRNNRYYLLSSDILAFICSYALGGYVFWQIRHSEKIFQFFWNWTSVFIVIVPVCIAWFYLKGHYTRRWPFWDELRDILNVLAVITIVDGAVIFLTKSSFPRIWFATSFFSIFFLLPIARRIVKKLLLLLGRWNVPTVILGNGDNASDVVQALRSEPLMGFNVRFFWSADDPAETEFLGLPLRNIQGEFETKLAEEGINCVIVALDDYPGNSGETLFERLHRYTKNLYLVPPMRGVPLYGMEIHHFFRHDVMMMRVCNNLLRPSVRFFKRTTDIIGAVFFLLFLSPLLIVVGGLVRIDGNPILYEQSRVGLKGTSFKCLKFRTMVENADAVLKDLLANDPQAKSEWTKDHKLKNDPRITTIGSLLRHFSLDELPQLWNVLKGEMSLVGPRPLVEDEIEKYGDQVDYYLKVRPGMTGLWQVSGRNDVDYSHRVYLDVWYVKNWSLWYDIAILFKTFKAVLKKQGAY